MTLRQRHGADSGVVLIDNRLVLRKCQLLQILSQASAPVSPKAGASVMPVCMAPTRKLIGFDDETSQAVELLSRDTGKTVQQLAYEAFTDLLAKHHRRAP
jgi:Antitoxin-like ribbon-helix-helix